MIENRNEAGKRLAIKLESILKKEEAIVLAIPRGGVVVGKEISEKLNCPLDVIISKKITPPHHPEYAIGAITHDGTIYQGKNWNRFSGKPDFEKEITTKKNEAKRRLEQYRGNYEYQFNGKTVILVDDGIATGNTVYVLLKWLAEQKVKKTILAVPVIASNTYEEMKPLVFEIVALEIPMDFYAVGQYYREFNQVNDDEVKKILEKFKN